ncbi:hypothetical protein MMC25_006269 [Agyrium rufum]|nr:hypothetical protein [Agyrium rufum]
MSFFGFDTTIPRDRGHPSQAPGFGQAQDPFAGLSRDRALEDEDDDGIDFEDTYDGLGDRLDETGDDLNDDTFGGGSVQPVKASKNEGKDFDFFGSTAKVSDAIQEEQLRYQRQQPAPRQVSQPAKTGYEKYKSGNYESSLQFDPALWGVTSQSSSNVNQAQLPAESAPVPKAAPSRKMMSLEEVEAAMAAQSRRAAGPMPAQQQPQQQPSRQDYLQSSLPQEWQYAPQDYSFGRPSEQPILQAPSQQIDPRLYQQQVPHQPPNQARMPPPLQPRPSQQQTDQQYRPPAPAELQQDPQDGMRPQVLSNPNRQPMPQPSHARPSQPYPHQGPPVPSRGNQFPVITHPEQLMHLSEEERTAILAEDAKRARRNHKIFLLSKDNGLMTPQDKNFITRIQLQQLMAATGNVHDQDPDAALGEDFYYQVHSQIRGGPRQNPHQPLSQFAQTYLFQTRQGGFGRRHQRGGDNHMQRMQQQVQRAVEAAKLKPKNKQLIIEGSLGKISFSNAKTPKPLLNLKRTESSDVSNRPKSASGRRPQTQTELSASDRKVVLRNIEALYSTLMRIEDEARKEPPPPNADADPSVIQSHMEWAQHMNELHGQLWSDLKILEPINPGSAIPHPFIAILSHAKGKKAIPRAFRYINHNERITMLTMIIVHLDLLDVIRLGQLQPGENQLPASAREAVALFDMAVMPGLMNVFDEAELNIIIGMVGLILDRTNMQNVARTKIGLGILTSLVSRAEPLRQEASTSDEHRDQWFDMFNRLFDAIESYLGMIFPGSVSAGDDVYCWVFLAAMGANASLEQQQRLVIGVKDRVMETVMQIKTLPPELASQRAAEVNIFMHAIGLDIGQLG